MEDPVTGSMIYFDESRAIMRKVSNADLDITKEREIRPWLRRTPNEIPMFLRMMDSSMQPYGIVMKSGLAVTAIKMSPNPEQITVNSAKMTNRYQTMTRWVEEHWGDEIDQITISGSSFSFFGYALNGKFPGLLTERRGLTEAYRFLRELKTVFTYDGFIIQDNRTYEGSIGTLRIEGYVSPVVEAFLSDPVNADFVNNHPREGLVKERLYVNLVFDYLSCMGYLDTFDVSEDSSSPFKMTYTIVFKSEKTTYRQGSIAGGK